MKIITRILLVVAVAFVGYLCFNSVVTPIKFEKEKEKREVKVIERLVSLRTAELQYRLDKREFTDNADSLIIYLKTAKKKDVYKKGSLTEKQLEDGMTEEKAVRDIQIAQRKAVEKNPQWMHLDDKNHPDYVSNPAKYIKAHRVRVNADSLDAIYEYIWKNDKNIIEKGLVEFRRDTVYKNMIQSLYEGQYTEETIGEIIYIPYTKNKKFDIQTNNDYTNTQGVRVPIFEISAHYDTYLHDLNAQERVNHIDKRQKLEQYPGLKVGSIEAPNNNAGNWE